MIPFVNLAPAIQYLWHVILFLRYKKNDDNDFDEYFDIILFTSMSMKIICQYLSMCAIVLRRLNNKTFKPRSFSLKPHILITLLHHYR